MTSPNPAATSEQDRESASRLLLEIEKCLFSEDTDHRCTCIEKIMAHVASLRRELDEARRDGERLDWLEAQRAVSFGFPVGPAEAVNDMELGAPINQVLKTGLGSHKQVSTGTTKRACIDAAMDDPKKEDGPNTAARRANFPQNYCKHNILKGHCPSCP